MYVSLSFAKSFNKPCVQVQPYIAKAGVTNDENMLDQYRRRLENAFLYCTTSAVGIPNSTNVRAADWNQETRYLLNEAQSRTTIRLSLA